MDATLVRRLLAHHGLPDAAPVRSAREGVANATWFCDQYVVRIGKDPEYEYDAYTESVAAPAARLAGILTPLPVVFDFSRKLVDAPVSIFERAMGDPVDAMTAGAVFWRSLGAEVRRVHDLVRDAPDPKGYLDEPWTVDPNDLIQRAPNDVAREWALRLGAIPLAPLDTFVHQDMHLDNVLQADGRLSAILDWGDAGWGEPACDLRYVPPVWIGAALDGYGRDDGLFIGRVALHLLDHALDPRRADPTSDLWDALRRLSELAGA